MLKHNRCQMLHIQLLGDFQLCYGDQPVTTVNQARVQSLLAYLLLHRHAPQARQQLAFTFWPDVSEAQARNNLRRNGSGYSNGPSTSARNSSSSLKADASTRLP